MSNEPTTVKIDNVEFVRKDSIQQKEINYDEIASRLLEMGEPPYAGVMLIETVTKYFVGEIVAILPQEIVIRDACWVACTGRYNEFLRTGDGGKEAEFEPCQDGLAIIGRGSIVNAQPHSYGLIRVVK